MTARTLLEIWWILSISVPYEKESPVGVSLGVNGEGNRGRRGHAAVDSVHAHGSGAWYRKRAEQPEQNKR